MKYLAIAEKPSLMKKMYNVYKNNRNNLPGMDIDFVSQAGHLLCLKNPDEINKEKYGKWKLENLPIDVPYVYKIAPGKDSLYLKIKDAIDSGAYDAIIHAGDTDQEGQLLIDIVLERIGNRLPVKRIWWNAETEDEILDGLQNLKDNSLYQNLHNSAMVRQHLDYQFGMNITVASTVKSGRLFRLGRVKAPIIKAIVDREHAINEFVEHSTYKRTFIYKDLEFLNEEEFETEEDALKTLQGLQKEAIVSDVKENIKKTKAPKLYKLSTLQADAYRAYGLTPEVTLSALQHLYEDSLVSYPRSACEYLSSHEPFEKLVSFSAKILEEDTTPFLAKIPDVKKDSTYINDKKTAEEGHTAIIPTGEGNLASIGTTEKKIYALVVKRFLAVFAEEKITKHRTVKAIPKGSNIEFTYKDSEDLQIGFERILNTKYKVKKASSIIFEKDLSLLPIEFQTKECVSKPPARFNAGSLVEYLDKIEYETPDGKIIYQIGTSATRTNIVLECIANEYFTCEKGVYYAAPNGEEVIKRFGHLSLFDVKTSGEWEALLDKIRKGQISAEVVENNLLKQCHEITKEIVDSDIEKLSFTGSGELLGKCPHCGGDIITGKFGAYCKERCGISLKVLGKELSKTQLRSLLSGKKTLVKGLESAKTGKTYDAYITLTGTESSEYLSSSGEKKIKHFLKFEMSFPFKKKK